MHLIPNSQSNFPSSFLLTNTIDKSKAHTEYDSFTSICYNVIICNTPYCPTEPVEQRDMSDAIAKYIDHKG